MTELHRINGGSSSSNGNGNGNGNGMSSEHADLKAQAFAALRRVRTASGTQVNKTRISIRVIDDTTRLYTKMICEVTQQDCKERGCVDEGREELCGPCRQYESSWVAKEAPER